jgi:hypothetical protein
MTDKPPQRPYDQALQQGLVTLISRVPSPETLLALGATMTAGIIRVPVLNRCLGIDLEQRRVVVDESDSARCAWAVLAVHYLCAVDFAQDHREVSFSYFQDCRNYLDVFGKRITARFLATAGRTAEQFVRLGEQYSGTRVKGHGTGFRFDVFPRVPITIIRYEGDSEVPAGASIIYRADVEHLLPAEDRVVAVELLLDILSGKPMTDTGGEHERRI